VIVISKQNWARVAAVVAIAAALGLSACGRKGPLDLPPGAAQHSAQPVSDNMPAPPPLTGIPEPQPGLTRDGKALAPPPRGDNRPFILDWLVQ
jgi:predicted small lipoprotein YifL